MRSFLIVETCGNVSSNPTTMAIIDELVKRGHHVDILTPAGTLNDSSRPQRWREYVSVRDYRPDFASTQVHGGLAARFVRQAKSTVNHLREGNFVDPLVTERRNASQYSCIIGIDPLGIIAADQINQVACRPLIYLSFELLLRHELESESERDLKRRETIAIGNTNLFMLQDDERCNLFCKDNAVSRERCLLVPVAPNDCGLCQNQYLQEKLSIPKSQHIVLYQGSLATWSGRDDFAEMVSYWPDNVVLVVHSRVPLGTRMRRYFDSFNTMGKIVISDQPISADDLPMLTASADIGLAPYRPGPDHWTHGDNLRYIGLASGKIAYYAMCGLPILTRRMASLTEIIEGNGAGLCYERLADTGELVRTLLANREHFSRMSREFYLRCLSPEKYIGPFCDRMERLAS